MWRHAALSVGGSRHVKFSSPCEDASTSFVIEDSKCLVLIATDGAGSADSAALGSNLVVEAVRDFFEKPLNNSFEEASFEALLIDAARYARESLENQVIPLVALASTLLIVVLSEKGIAALQIGDGFIVHKTEQQFELLLEPFKGQYANETCFLTSLDSFDDLLEAGFVKTKFMQSVPNCVFVLTDGLEPALLNAATQELAPLFFERLSKQFGNDPDFTAHLSHYLINSEKLKQLTDDDKTIVIAQQCKEGSA